MNNELPIHTAIWIKLTDKVQCHRSQTKEYRLCDSLYVKCEKGEANLCENQERGARLA